MTAQMKIRVKSSSYHARDVQVETGDGKAVDGIRSIEFMPIHPEGLITALFHLRVEMVDIEVHPLVSMEVLQASAAHFGFVLMPKVDFDV